MFDILFFEAADKYSPLIEICVGDCSIPVSLVDAFCDLSADTKLAWKHYMQVTLER